MSKHPDRRMLGRRVGSCPYGCCHDMGRAGEKNQAKAKERTALRAEILAEYLDMRDPLDYDGLVD